MLDDKAAPAADDKSTAAPAADAKPAEAVKADAKPVSGSDKPVTGDVPADKAPAAKSGSTSIFDDVDDDEDDSDGDAAPVDTKGDGKAADDAGDKGDKAPSKWPDDWRDQIAGGDEKYRKELGRFSSFDAYAKSQRALRQKLSSGEYKRAEAFDPEWNDEQKATWRKDNGIPDKPDGYEMPKVDGYEFTEADKPGVELFMGKMHAANAPPAAVKEALGVYAALVAQAKERITNLDREHKVKLEDDLRAEWGNDYRPNLKLMDRALKDAEFLPGGMGEGGLGTAFRSARMPDGTALINHPGFAGFLAQLARERYGEAAMLPGAEVAALSSREDEIKRIMQTDMERYWREKNAQGQTMADELLEIRRRKAGNKR